jgi:aldehyde dehydrogenase (NAD+)
MSTSLLEPASSSRAPVAPASMRHAAPAWAATSLAERLQVLQRMRHELANASESLVQAISPELSRTHADSYAAEILPLLEACRFLERQAHQTLAPRRLGRKGLPFWLSGVESTVERVPLGTVLLIGPANYPLFLPGVQALQALAAGNAVVWKPGRNGAAVAEAFLAVATRAGLPPGALRVRGESVDAAVAEIEARPDKIVFTGSSLAGREVMRRAAELAVPVLAELSGCDAVVALESADLNRLVDALAFGMRLNGSATCMAPRRLFLVGRGHEQLLAQLEQRFSAMDGIELPLPTRTQLRSLIAEAEQQGASVRGNAGAALLKPVLVLDATPQMQIAQSDVFAPVLTVLAASSLDDLIEQDRLCPFGLTAAIFGEPGAARELGAKLKVGTVIVNDLMVPTADPRVPFGGRRGSGYGVTRGPEGLLEMSAVKVTLVRSGNSTQHYQETGPAHQALFRGAVQMSHSATLRERFQGLRALIAAARNLK